MVQTEEGRQKQFLFRVVPHLLSLPVPRLPSHQPVGEWRQGVIEPHGKLQHCWVKRNSLFQEQSSSFFHPTSDPEGRRMIKRGCGWSHDRPTPVEHKHGYHMDWRSPSLLSYSWDPLQLLPLSYLNVFKIFSMLILRFELVKVFLHMYYTSLEP